MEENNPAYYGINQILSKLKNQEVTGLANTITQGLLKRKVTTVKDAIEVIVKYSPNLQNILRRKVVTRDILFEYIHENNVPISLPVTKNDLIDIVCQYWNYNSPNLLENPSNTAISTVSSQELITTINEVLPEINTMALKFVEWFYSLMNSNDPIDISHFWTDAKLKLNLISGAEMLNDTIEDVQEIVQKLFTTKCEHNLYFNPNMSSEGVQGRRDPHGLVVILSCGTLHSNNICVGVYEQVFMLARDPFSDNNWKIKNTEMNLKSKSNVSALPSLCDSSLTNTLLALPNS